MSPLVRYTLKDADDHAAQTAAMQALVAGLKDEAIAGLDYSCFETDVATEFVGVLELADQQARQAFLNSRAFAAYKATIGPLFANPPQTNTIATIASTRA